MGNEIRYDHLPMSPAFEDTVTEAATDDASMYEREKLSLLTPKRGLARVWVVLFTAAATVFVFASGVLLGATIPDRLKKSVPNHIHPHPTHIHPHPNHKASATLQINGVDTEGTQCGTTWEEAKAMGCKFDVMASRWYAPECSTKWHSTT